MDLVYITDFSLPIMNTLTAKLAGDNVPVTVYTLDRLIEKQRNMPQQECPLVSEGHKAHHDDDHHEEDHDDNDHDDGHHEDAYNYDIHGFHDLTQNDKTGTLLVRDFQTENMSYYTLARDYPHGFARKGKRIIQIKNMGNVVFLGLRQIGVKTGEKLIEKHEIIKRKRLLPPTRYHKMFVVWLSEIEQIQRLLRMFAETITLCYQYIDVGIYDPNDG